MATVQYGIIGCGNIGPVHAAAISAVRGAKLAAVSDVVAASAEKLAGEYKAEVYSDYRAMLERKDIHAVCLCVPSGMRAEMALACAAAGKHILAEKPLEVTTARIDRIVAAADKAGVLLGCIFQSRFSDGAQQIRKAVEEGRFGKLVLGDAYIKWYRSPEYYASGAWRGTRRLDGGGVLMNQGIHQIDLLRWFFGPVKSVRAHIGNVVHTSIEVEDVAAASLEFSNGALGVIEGTTAAWPGHAAEVNVFGSEGGARLSDGKLVYWQFAKEKPSDKKIIEGMTAGESELGSGAADPLASLKIEGHRRQIEDFTKAIQQNRKPAIDGREGRYAVELIEAIYKAARAGRTVTLGA